MSNFVICNNTATSQPNISCRIGTGTLSTSSSYSSILGGGSITNCGEYSTVIMGQTNTINPICTSPLSLGLYNTVLNGLSNTISGSYNSILGGCLNSIEVAPSNQSSFNNTIVGGNNNCISQSFNTGSSCYNAQFNSFIGGGFNNNINCAGAIIVGGGNNTASGQYSIVVGGGSNEVCDSGLFSGIFSGGNNTLSATYSFIGGGIRNFSYGTTGSPYTLNSVVGGRDNCILGGSYDAIVGGICNSVAGFYSIVGGGFSNVISGDKSVIGGGCRNNVVDVNYSGIFSGENNTVCRGLCCIDNHSVIAGGYFNVNEGCNAFIGGGEHNFIQAQGFGSITGGQWNQLANTDYSLISGGCCNLITFNNGGPSISSGIFSGDSNSIIGSICSAILNGCSNVINGHCNVGVSGAAVVAVSDNTFHVNCLNANSTPNVTAGVWPAGTIGFKPFAALTPTDNVLVQC